MSIFYLRFLTFQCFPGRGHTFETVKGERVELVVVQLEHLQRVRQRRNLVDVVAVKVKRLQEGQALQGRRVGTGQEG